MAYLVDKCENTTTLVKPFLEWNRCHSHQNNITESAVLAAMGVNMLSRLYSLSLFIRTTGYWLRMLQSTRKWVQDNLVVCLCEPQADCKIYRDEILDYVQCHRNSHMIARAHDNLLGKGAFQFQQTVELFMAVCNGCLWSDILTHHCQRTVRPWCCENDDESRKKYADVFNKFCNNALPPTPAAVWQISASMLQASFWSDEI
jgi:hypothetical protein